MLISFDNAAGRRAAASPPAPASRPRPARPESPADADPRAAELCEGLLRRSARIDPKFLYDAQGCVLFSAICELDEYYPTRTEREIFRSQREAIAQALPDPLQWVDLGCGDCAKSRDWLSHVGARRYLGVDIAAEWVTGAVASLGAQHPGIECVAVGADFTAGFDIRDRLGDVQALPPVLFYPGSSIGNFAPDVAVPMLAGFRRHLGPHGRLLISADLRKDTAVMKRAYADALGVTAAFNRNVLRVCNRLTGSDFRPENFLHQARFDEARSCIEMRLVAGSRQFVRIGGQLRVFEEGEAIVTEHSYKYTPERFGALLDEAGFSSHRMWTDPHGWFGVFLAQP
ncbi:L-histidine N(alpha)-methyltransferase [Pigmentiphaga soli]|uniref:L-histidine N(Alpha)-methyltransferase n=1 Tax=Pigmentiphaga soli TaxID=1007095 RepID=A0ABP8GP80_9BURK